MLNIIVLFAILLISFWLFKSSIIPGLISLFFVVAGVITFWLIFSPMFAETFTTNVTGEVTSLDGSSAVVDTDTKSYNVDTSSYPIIKVNDSLTLKVEKDGLFKGLEKAMDLNGNIYPEEEIVTIKSHNINLFKKIYRNLTMDE
ncbi:hypothetical protein ABE28_003160 [Peribacillus muralis]|uniref:Uncharacterized protein n=1 Tax=Peribacillus muralis TaxID=264697 RepID=A0A1B3XJE5_9BACI|nr:hypothetical protein [Peribacillus muralis]AOH53338.1 hypothetical protein ABE28_003160 [Peribacillus muralis]